MTVILFKNKLAGADRYISILDAQIGDIDAPRESIIDRVEALTSFYYGTDNLVIRLQPDADETPTTARRFWSRDGSLAIQASVWWKKTNNPRPFRSDQYQSFKIDLGSSRGPSLSARGYNTFELASLTDDFFLLELQLNDLIIPLVDDYFSGIGITKPEYGFVVISIYFVDGSGVRTSQSFIFKYTHNPVFATGAVLESEIPVVENSYTTSPNTYETLYVPNLSASFEYNFYEINETNLNAILRRNYNTSKLTDIPKYIQLKWGAAPIDLSVTLAEGPAPAPITPPSGPTIPGTGTTTSDIEETEDAIRSTSPPISSDSADAVRSAGGGGFFGGVFVGGEDGGGRDIFGGISTSGGPARTGTSGVGTTTSDISDSERRLRETEPAIESEAVGIVEIVGANPDAESITIEQQVNPDIFNPSLGTSEYIGYIILKERVDPITEEVEVIDIIAIPRRTQTSYTDWKVAYGETYRYKIRSIYRFVNNHGLSMYEDTDALLSRRTAALTFDGGLAVRSVYYFDSPFSDPAQIDALEFVRPDPPSDFQIYPNSKKRQIFITWSQKAQNKDVDGFNIYRKQKNKNFIRLNQDLLSIRNNYFFDNNVDFDEEYIYAIQSVDVHNNSSKLSLQLIAQITSGVRENLSPILCEKKIKFYTFQGLELNENPQEIKNTEIIRFLKQITVVSNPLFRNTNEATTFLLKIKSLDTLQEKEMKLKFKTRIINHRRTIPTIDAPAIIDRSDPRRINVDESSVEIGDFGTDIFGFGRFV